MQSDSSLLALCSVHYPNPVKRVIFPLFFFLTQFSPNLIIFIHCKHHHITQPCPIIPLCLFYRCFLKCRPTSQQSNNRACSKAGCLFHHACRRRGGDVLDDRGFGMQRPAHGLLLMGREEALLSSHTQFQSFINTHSASECNFLLSLKRRVE